MTPEQATFLCQQVYLPQIQMESKTTRRVIEAVPAAKCSYTPDPKSMEALKLSWHIASAEIFFLSSVAKGAFGRPDGGNEIPETIKTPADVVKWYDENLSNAIAAVKAMSGEQLAKNIDFFGFFNLSGVEYLSLSLRHGIHHRGQLSAYLRPMGAKVPGIYGPSGDEGVTPPSASANA
jgi:uncharacterized damage-inducible protein DinB